MFDGRRSVVTGWAGSIGSACARQLLDAGAKVLIVDNDASRLATARAALGGGDRLAMHVSRLASPAEAGAALDAAGGPIHGLIHMAGLCEPDPPDLAGSLGLRTALAENLTNGYGLALACVSHCDADSVFKERGESLLATIPPRGFGQPEKGASVVSFLCGDEASFITGQTIII